MDKPKGGLTTRFGIQAGAPGPSARTGETDLFKDDPTAQWLDTNGWVLKKTRDKWHTRCPNVGEHTSPSGVSECTYMAAHTGGNPRPRWTCAHAHCNGKSHDEMLHLAGWTPIDEFEIRSDEPEAGMAEPKAASMAPQRLDLAALAGVEPHPPKFILPGWLPQGEVTLFSGHGGVGKSATALFLLVCIALGIDWCGIVTQRRRCAYFSYEDSAEVLHWRLSRICAFLGVELASLAGWLDVYDGTSADAVLFEESHKGTQLTKAYAWVRDALRGTGAQVIATDGAADVYAANENSRPAVKAFIRAIRMLIPRDGAAILLAHVDKAAAKSTVATSQGYSGSTSWSNSVRARWYLRPEHEDLAESGKPSDLVVIELQKVNSGASGARMALRWDPAAHLHVPDAARNVEPAVRRLEHDEVVFSLVADAYKRGDAIPATEGGPYGYKTILRHKPGLPSDLRQARTVGDCVSRLLQSGRLVAKLLPRSNRKVTRCLVPGDE